MVAAYTPTGLFPECFSAPRPRPGPLLRGARQGVEDHGGVAVATQTLFISGPPRADNT